MEYISFGDKVPLSSGPRRSRRADITPKIGENPDLGALQSQFVAAKSRHDVARSQGRRPDHFRGGLGGFMMTESPIPDSTKHYPRQIQEQMEMDHAMGPQSPRAHHPLGRSALHIADRPQHGSVQSPGRGIPVQPIYAPHAPTHGGGGALMPFQHSPRRHDAVGAKDLHTLVQGNHREAQMSYLEVDLGSILFT